MYAIRSYYVKEYRYMKKLLIKNAKIICAKSKINKVADLLIENGKIKEIGENISVGDAEIINAENLTLIPGMVDMHCHLRITSYNVCYTKLLRF